MSPNTEQSKMAAVRLFEDAILSIQQKKVIRCIKAIDMAAIFEKAQLDRIKGQELFQIPRLRPSEGIVSCFFRKLK